MNFRRFRGLTVLIISVLLVLSFGISRIFAAPSAEDNGGEVYQESNEPAPDVQMSPEDLSSTFRATTESVIPVVVEVNVIEVVRQQVPNFQNPFEFFFGPQGRRNGSTEERERRVPGLGSGVIVGRDGNTVYVISNNHVVGDADEISVGLSDGRDFEASVVGTDPRTDLALVEFTTNEDVPIATLGDSDNLHVGDWVLAIGNPYGFESTVTAGIVSALGRRADASSMGVAAYTDYIQTDAAINPGNSGGALVNLNGEIVGINTWIASQSGGSVGIGFAIPINNAKRAIEDFVETGRIRYGWLGVLITDVDTAVNEGLARDLGIGDETGALVTNVHYDSPAYEDGILPGDFIIQADEQDIRNIDHLTQFVGNIAPGTQIDFTVIRNARERQITVTLDERPEEQELQGNRNLWPGLSVTSLTSDIAREIEVPDNTQGVVAYNVIEETPGALAGIRTGDVISRVNDSQITTVREFYNALNSAEGEEIRFRVNRKGNEFIVGIIR